MEEYKYHVNVTWTRDRRGVLTSPELSSPDYIPGGLEVATPPEFAKGIPGIWSPEHLFTAAVNSCLMTTFLAIAENSKLDFISFQCGATGKLEKVNEKFQMTEVLLNPVVVISNHAQIELCNRVIRKAEANCLISNSVTSSVVVNAKVVVESAAAIREAQLA